MFFPTSDTLPVIIIKEMILIWIYLQNLAEKYHPDTVITNRTVNILNDNVMAHFRNISKHRQKQKTLGKLLLKIRTIPKQVLPDLMRH